MNQPEQQQIDHWVNNAHYQIERAWRLNREGFHKKHEVPLQSVYIGVAGDYASLARAKFLNGDPIEEARTEFANAARHVMKSFTMAYDENNPDYLGKNADLTWVMEDNFIEGANYALMSADFNLAAELAGHYRTRPDGEMLDINANRYANALALTMQGRQKEALPLLVAQFEEYKKKPPKLKGYHRNYYTLILALFGIVAKDGKLFNEGLKLQLEFYQGYAKGEGADTDEEFICDHAVALAILGQRNLMWVKIAHDTLPRGLLLK